MVSAPQHRAHYFRLYENSKPSGIFAYERSPVERFGHGLFFVDLDAVPPTLYFSSLDNSDPNDTPGAFSLAIGEGATSGKGATTAALPLAEFEQFLVPLALRYLDQVGDPDRFYRSRLGHKEIMGQYEHNIADYLLRTFPPSSTSITEVGPGFGQLLLFLAIHGFSAIGIDKFAVAVRRAAALKAACCEVYPDIDGRYHITHDDFPKNGLQINPNKRNIALFTNLGLGFPEEFCDRVIAAIEPADFVLLDMRRFFRDRDEDEQIVLQRKIEARYGTSGVQVFKTRNYSLMIFQLK